MESEKYHVQVETRQKQNFFLFVWKKHCFEWFRFFKIDKQGLLNADENEIFIIL